MSYQLIALDLDGTLLNEKKQISDRNKSAILKAREQGKQVVIATGRPLAGIRHMLEELEMTSENDFVIAFNGALVQNVKTGEAILKSHVTHEDYAELYRLSLVLDVHIQALTESYVTTPVYNPYTEIEASLNGIKLDVCPVHEVPEFETLIKVMMVDAPEKLDRVLHQLPDWVKEKYTIVRSAPIFLEFLHPSVNKGVGVAAVADLKKINRENVICVGDADNDMAMVTYAGLGVAMGNAIEALKDAANHITDTNERDGVAQVIENYMIA